MIPDPTASSAAAPAPRLHRFAANAVWGALSVAANLVAGVLLSPYLIRKLGSDGYGIWSLVFSIANYYTVLDFGFRSAVINFTARELATENYSRLNELLSTALAYSAVMSVVALAAMAAVAPSSARLFGISPEFQDRFPTLFVIVSTGVALSLCFNIVSGCLEGFQQFGALRRAQTAVMAVRTLAYVLVLWFGGGLIALSLCTFASVVALWIAYAWLLRRVFPQVQLAWRLVRTDFIRAMVGYGFHTSANGVASILLEQTPPVLIARQLPDAAVGYFALPLRIVQIPLGVIRTATEMLNPLAAEFLVRREYDALARVGILGNRYGYILYAPFALVLMTWGRDIVRLWVGEEYAANAGPLLFFFALGSWIAQAGQGATIGILFGMRAHHWCAWGLMGEAVVVAVACVLFVNQGLVVLAVWICAAMLANRGALSAWAMCRNLQYPFAPFLWSIYGVPSLLAVPVYFLLAKLSEAFPEKNWWLVLAATAAASAVYLAPAFWLCVEKPHQRAAAFWLRKIVRLEAFRS